MMHFKSIAEFHRCIGVPAPLHPHISLLDVSTVPESEHDDPGKMSFGFYSIAVKKMLNVRVQYGQHPFDFHHDCMSFMAPNQVFSVKKDVMEKAVERSGWVIHIHPDFLWNTALAKTISRYEFWDYTLSEGLFLSQKEHEIIRTLILSINGEYNAHIDKFSRSIIISQIETLLNYSDRFYNRQFITHEKANHELLEKFEMLLKEYFKRDDLVAKGLPTVSYLASSLNMSPKYLSSLLKTITGQNAQQLIHEKLIEKAKESLSTTGLSVSEIAYALGFEHLQSFSKLFKAKTSQSPLEYRSSFN